VFLQAGRDGNASSMLRGIHAQLGLAGRFRMLGHRNDVGDLMAASDVLVLPSRVEGVAGAVIEAMAMRLPVVCSDLPSLREVVEVGGNAVVTPVDDADALSAAIESLLADRRRREAFAERSGRRFEERFDLDRSVSRMLDLYRAVVADDKVMRA
jgi:glycosyltransferase involved in cell wall biosynthesis